MEHLRTLKLVNYAMGALALGIAVLFLLMFGGMGLLAWRDGQEFGLLFVGMGVLVGALAGTMGVLHLVLGPMLERGQGRILQTVLAVFQLGSFPIGTAYGIFALWVLWSHGPTKSFFDSAGTREAPPTAAP